MKSGKRGRGKKSQRLYKLSKRRGLSTQGGFAPRIVNKHGRSSILECFPYVGPRKATGEIPRRVLTPADSSRLLALGKETLPVLSSDISGQIPLVLGKPGSKCQSAIGGPFGKAKTEEEQNLGKPEPRETRMELGRTPHESRGRTLP